MLRQANWLQKLPHGCRAPSSARCITFERTADFKKAIGRTPNHNFAWTNLHVITVGKYTFCTTSDDGSHLYSRYGLHQASLWYGGAFTATYQGPEAGRHRQRDAVPAQRQPECTQAARGFGVDAVHV